MFNKYKKLLSKEVSLGVFVVFVLFSLYYLQRDLSVVRGEKVVATVTGLHQAANCGGMFPFDLSTEVDCASIEFTTKEGKPVKSFASLMIVGKSGSRPIIKEGEKREVYYVKSDPQRAEFDWRIAQKKREFFLMGLLIVVAGGFLLYRWSTVKA